MLMTTIGMKWLGDEQNRGDQFIEYFHNGFKGGGLVMKENDQFRVEIYLWR